jgi:arylsulfatase A-like enzyme
MNNKNEAMGAGRWSALWISAGTVIVGVAVFYDWIFGGSPGFGQRQALLALAGACVLGVGVWQSPNTRARVTKALMPGPDQPALSAAQIMLAAVMFASATALLEGVVLGISFFVFGELLRLGLHVVWMSALANAFVLLTLGAILYGIGLVWRVVRTPFVVAFLFALLSADTVVHRITLAGRADPLSAWLLAGGIAAIVARSFAARSGRESPWLGRRAAVLAGAVGVMAIVAFGRNPTTEWMARARLADVAPGRPNILLIILDTVRAPSLSLFGHTRPTSPQLVRFAEGAVVFDFAISPSSWTLPSHATLFTGRPPNELSADWLSALDDADSTLAEVLGARGYVTAGFSANSAYANANTGLARGFDRFEDFPATAGEAARTAMMSRRVLQIAGFAHWLRDGYTGRKSAADIGGAFVHWLDGVPADRPFFAFLNYMDAHDPYIAAPPFDTMFGPVLPYPDLDRGRDATPDVVAAWTDGYDRAIAYIDHELGLLFDEIDRRGTLDNTIVVVTSDHGEHLGEHGFMRHGNTLHRPVLHVPLIVRYPDAAPTGRRIEEPVALRDVPSTLLELAGIEGTPLPGVSLARFWNTGGETGSPVLSEVRQAVRSPQRYPNANADLHALVHGGFQYIRSSDGREEFYDHVHDVAEARNLVETGEAATQLNMLRQRLARLLGESDTVATPNAGAATN